MGSQRVRHNWATELNRTRSGEPLGGLASEFIISQDIVSLGKGIPIFRWPHRNVYDLFVKWDRQGLKHEWLLLMIWVIIRSQWVWKMRKCVTLKRYAAPSAFLSLDDTFISFLPYLLVKWSASRLVVSNSLWPRGLHSPWNSPGQNTGVSTFSLLQGIFPTQESDWGLLHCKRILYQLSYRGRIHFYFLGVVGFHF